jgi:hypothetical protein
MPAPTDTKQDLFSFSRWWNSVKKEFLGDKGATAFRSFLLQKDQAHPVADAFLRASVNTFSYGEKDYEKRRTGTPSLGSAFGSKNWLMLPMHLLKLPEFLLLRGPDLIALPTAIAIDRLRTFSLDHNKKIQPLRGALVAIPLALAGIVYGACRVVRPFLKAAGLALSLITTPIHYGFKVVTDPLVVPLFNRIAASLAVKPSKHREPWAVEKRIFSFDRWLRELKANLGLDLSAALKDQKLTLFQALLSNVRKRGDAHPVLNPFLGACLQTFSYGESDYKQRFDGKLSFGSAFRSKNVLMFPMHLLKLPEFLLLKGPLLTSLATILAMDKLAAFSVGDKNVSLLTKPPQGTTAATNPFTPFEWSKVKPWRAALAAIPFMVAGALYGLSRLLAPLLTVLGTLLSLVTTPIHHGFKLLTDPFVIPIFNHILAPIAGTVAAPFKHDASHSNDLQKPLLSKEQHSSSNEVEFEHATKETPETPKGQAPKPGEVKPARSMTDLTETARQQEQAQARTSGRTSLNDMAQPLQNKYEKAEAPTEAPKPSAGDKPKPQ